MSFDETSVSSSSSLQNEQAGQTIRSITISLDGLLWVVLGVITIFLRLWMLDARVMSHDESLHVYFSWLLATGKGYAHNPMMHGPFLFEATALLNALFGANDFTSRLIPALLGSSIAIGIPLLLRSWLGRVGALATGVLLSLSPYLLYYSRYNRHDIQVIAWALLAFFAILAYQKTRNDRYLLLLAGSLALMFATMEITFIYLAIFAAFLLVSIFVRNGLHWSAIRQSAEFDLLIILVTLGAFFSSPIALLGMNPIWKRLSGQPFVELSALATFGIEWANGPAGPRLWGLLIGFSLLSILIGWWWGKVRWVKVAGLFLAISLLLFTTLFSNLNGVGTGLIGSLGYWLSQHDVQRGSQPWFYYLIVFPLYEFLPILLGISAAILLVVRRKLLDPTIRFAMSFCLFWALAILLALSIAGEKMPWLSTHLTIPWILPAGWGIGQILTSGTVSAPHWKSAGRWVAVGMTALLFLVSVRSSLRANFVNFDSVTEPIGYAHGAPGVKWAVEDIETLAEATGKRKSLVVAYDDQIAWPMSWYFREYPGFFGANMNPDTVLNADVVVVGPANWQKAELFLGAEYQRYEVIRMWWPLEDYKSLTLTKLRADWNDPQMRRALWQILWNRDYSSYATLTGQASIDPPRAWPLQESMRIYVRNELTEQAPPQKLGGSWLETSPSGADTYQDLRSPDLPVETFAGLGLSNPRNLTFGPDGVLYVADTGQSRILKLDAKGQLLATIGRRFAEGEPPSAPGTFNEPWGIAVDSAGNLYVADTWNHRIQKFDPQGNFLLQWGTGGISREDPSFFWGPRAIAVGPTGRVYVTDTGNSRVAIFTDTGEFLFDFDQGGTAALNEPVGLAIHEAHIYVADTWNQRVAVFTLDGQFQTSWTVQAWNSISLDNKPYLTVDQAGNVYASDPEGYRVIRFSPDGIPQAVLGLSDGMLNTLMMPAGVATDSQGRLWLTDAANQQLVVYAPED